MPSWENRFVIAVAFASLLAGMPSARAQSDVTVQFFPPIVPGTNPEQICGKSPNGYTYSLVWDGATTVQCATVPVTCPSGEGLVYDGANFQCIVPCMPQLITIGTTACASPDVGYTDAQQALQFCDGTVQAITAPASNCAPPQVTIPAISSISCTAGSSVSGAYVTVNGQQVFDPAASGSITCPSN
jgi:hypothetical protein